MTIQLVIYHYVKPVIKEVLRFDAVTSLSARNDPNNDMKWQIIADNDNGVRETLCYYCASDDLSDKTKNCNMTEFCGSAALPTCVC